jgi:cobyrinic acid a,c-diamide synthase
MMWRVPSVAVGAVQSRGCYEPMVWGLLGALTQAGVGVQAFASRAVPDSLDVPHKITGRPLRHLDSWVQEHDGTLSALYRGTADCHAAVLYGSFCGPGGGDGPGSDLATLCQRLSLPRIAVVDVAHLDPCRIPQPPHQLAGILLDRVSGTRSRIQCQTLLEALWDAPVLGWIDESLPARTLAEYLSAEQMPSGDLLLDLAESLSASLHFDRLTQLAQRSQWLPTPMCDGARGTGSPRLGVRVAVAYDEAFPCYSTDTLEMLEAAGACVRDFSPLKCERLPERTDVVLLGTGTHDRYWLELARNCCLQQSLRCFAAAGGRVYAEGSGLAYISRQVVTAEGDSIPMAGLIPAIARRISVTRQYEPVELTTGSASWLFPALEELRGYRETDWAIIPAGPMLTYARQRELRLDLLARGNVIGSRVVFHFASRPEILQRFLAPFAPPPAVASAVR